MIVQQSSYLVLENQDATESSVSPSQSSHQESEEPTAKKTWTAIDSTINAKSGFSDYVEFMSEKAKFEKATYQVFVHRDSKSYKDGDAKTHPYRYKKWCCMLWQKPENIKSKASGKPGIVTRPVQHYHASSCEAHISIKLDTKTNRYNIISFSNVHTHELKEEHFKICPQNRRLEDADEKEIYRLYNLGVAPGRIAQSIKKVFVTSQDVKNTKRKLQQLEFGASPMEQINNVSLGIF